MRRRVNRTESERFWEYVDRGVRCWEWTGAQSHGYGNFFVRRDDGTYGQVAAHRFAYAQLVGDIPDGLVIDHLCRNKLCVRPQHLQPVPQQVNVLRGDVARALRENACRNGHAFTSENTHINTKGARVCLICRRASEARYRERKRKSA